MNVHAHTNTHIHTMHTVTPKPSFPAVVVLNKGEASGIVPNPCSFSHKLLSKLIAILRGESPTS